MAGDNPDLGFGPLGGGALSDGIVGQPLPAPGSPGITVLRRIPPPPLPIVPTPRTLRQFTPITSYLPPYVPPVFPTPPIPMSGSPLPGFPTKWMPTFKTTILQGHSSGREIRRYNQIYALHEITLLFEVLRDQTQNQTPFVPLAGFTEYMQLCQQFIREYGTAGIFYFDAPWDDSRTGELIGTGDGTHTQFVIGRTFGTVAYNLTEPIGGINQLTTVYFDGSPIASDLYSVGRGYLLNFNTPPASGVTITADFSFYYRCRFMADNLDFEEFMKNIWSVKQLKMRSLIPLLLLLEFI